MLVIIVLINVIIILFDCCFIPKRSWCFFSVHVYRRNFSDFFNLQIPAVATEIDAYTVCNDDIPIPDVAFVRMCNQHTFVMVFEILRKRIGDSVRVKDRLGDALVDVPAQCLIT